MMSESEVQALLDAGFPDSTVEVANPQGDGEHYSVLIVSEQFEGLRRVQQHQLVYKALGDAMRDRIHALQLQTFTPAEWREQS